MSFGGEVVALRSGTAAWIGEGRDGFGFVSTGSGALRSQPYTVDSRFKSAAGTNPEELIAAAYVSSFTMYLALILTEAGYSAEHLNASALVSLESDPRGFSISRLQLVLSASVPQLDASTFQALANRAQANCAVSRLLCAELTLSARLIQDMPPAAALPNGSGRPT